jgi:uncharacterized damage-inducible protein DinB
MTPADLNYLYTRGFQALERNLEGFSHEESMIAPQPAGNCANWVLGHVIVHRSAVLEMLGAQPLWTETDGDPYGYGSKPLEATDARPLESLHADLKRAHERLIQMLETKTAADLMTEIPTKSGSITLGQRLGFLAAHEFYHAGQIALLRRIVGKPGAI